MRAVCKNKADICWVQAFTDKLHWQSYWKPELEELFEMLQATLNTGFLPFESRYHKEHSKTPTVQPMYLKRLHTDRQQAATCSFSWSCCNFVVVLFQTQDHGRSVQLCFISSFFYSGICDLTLCISLLVLCNSHTQVILSSVATYLGSVTAVSTSRWMPFLLQTQQFLACCICSLLFIGHQQPSIKDHCTRGEMFFYLNTEVRTAIMYFVFRLWNQTTHRLLSRSFGVLVNSTARHLDA